MQFKNGANVYSTDGKKVGHIDRVVMDPSTKEVTHVVVRQGTFFTEDKVVPVDLIHGAIEDGVQLQAAAADLDDLPYFEETHYLPIDRSAVDSMDEPRSIYWYPPVGVVPVGDYPYYAGEPYRVETERNIPDGMIALKEGASVISADDQKVGNVERVYTNDKMTQATHLLVKDGWLFQTEKVIPVSWIDNVTEDKIRLTIDAPVLEQVPPLR